jgi:hypothetical protein
MSVYFVYVLLDKAVSNSFYVASDDMITDFFPYCITAHVWALSSSVLRFLNHTHLDAR